MSDDKLIRLDTQSNVVVTGKSGAGKQPRIDVLVREFGLKQLSTGNIFRHYLGLFDSVNFPGVLDEFWSEDKGNFVPDSVISEQIKKHIFKQKNKGRNIDANPGDLVLGLKAKYFVEKGLFGPDELVNELLKASFSKNNYKSTVLDGYPRTVNQSEFLLNLTDDVNSNISVVLIVDNEDELIIERTMGRRICSECGEVYHIKFNPPNPDETCKKCSGKVIPRSDDSEEKIKKRLEEFRKKCIPAIKKLREAGIPVVHVNGNLEVFTRENVKKSVLEALENPEH